VSIPRSEFPELPADEFYWSDLIGLDVVNLQGEALGTGDRHDGQRRAIDPAHYAGAEEGVKGAGTADPVCRPVRQDR
jgi:16S rRNA processing protein RimM